MSCGGNTQSRLTSIYQAQHLALGNIDVRQASESSGTAIFRSEAKAISDDLPFCKMRKVVQQFSSVLDPVPFSFLAKVGDQRSEGENWSHAVTWLCKAVFGEHPLRRGRSRDARASFSFEMWG